MVVPYWLLHGSPALNQEGYFPSRKNINQSVFNSSEARIYFRVIVNKLYYFRIKVSRVITKVHRGILRGSPVIIIVYGLHHRISWCQNFSALKRVSIQRRTQREIYQAERDQLGSTRSSTREFLDFMKREKSPAALLLLSRVRQIAL